MKIKYSFAMIAVVLSGCISMDAPEEFKQEMDQVNSEIKSLNSDNRYVISDDPIVDYKAKKQKLNAKSKFDRVKVNISRLENGATLSSLIQMFQKKGLNVIAQNDVKLSHKLLKYSIKDVSAKGALEIITHDLGIGYQIMNEGSNEPYAIISGLPTFTYRLNVPNEVSTLKQFVSNKTREDVQGAGLSGGQQSGQSGGSSSGQGGSGGGDGDVNEITSVSEIKEEFWKGLNSYLEGVLTDVVTVSEDDDPSASGLYGPNGSAQARQLARSASLGIRSGITKKMVGTVITDPGTGFIRVSGPKHKLKEIKEHLLTLDILMNARISVEGKIIATTESATKREGLDITALAANCASSFRCIVSNSGLNGISITEPTADTYFNIGTQGLTGSSLLGIQGGNNSWQAFNAYTEEHENVKVIDTFTGVGGHGTKIDIKQTRNDINQILSSNPTSTSESGVTTQGGTENNIIPFKTGANVSIVPMLDIKNNTVKNIVDVKISLPGIRRTIRQSTQDGIESGTYQNVDELEFQVRPTLKNGQLLIVGGKTSHTYTGSKGGTSGLLDTVVGGLFGTSERIREKTTYYVLLQVKVEYDSIG